MKYIPEERYFYYTRQRAPEEQDSEIRLEIEYFTMSKRDGPFHGGYGRRVPC